LALVILAVGIVLSFTVFLLIGFAIWVPSAEAAGLPTGFALAVALAGAFCGPVLWIMGYHRFRWSLARAKTPFRDARLKRVVEQPNASARAPHRTIEFLLRSGSPRRQTAERVLTGLPPNIVVVALPRDGRYMPPPWRTQHSFEPIELDTNDAQGEWLLQQAWPQEGTEQEPESEARRIADRRRRRSASLLVYLGWLALVGYLVYGFLASDLHALAIPTLVLGLSILALLCRLVRERRWWAVPGGVVLREVAIGKAPKICRFDAGESPLVIHQAAKFAYVVRQGRLTKIPCQDHGQWVLLAAWISQARRPNVAEIVSYFEGRK
jgi:hypothetical protein